MIPITRFTARTVAIFGLARSGLSAALALNAGGAKVLGWDDNHVAREAAAAIGVKLSNPQIDDWSGVAAIILSPGVPLTHPKPHRLVDWAKARNIPIIGDVELFIGEQPNARIVGVTGTNGKSTTTALIGHLLAETGRKVQVGGNIGTPVLDLEPLSADGTYVLEMSSFQIDLTPSWRGDVAVLLNITPDHLDRHGSIDGYVAVKRRIFVAQRPNDVAVIGVDDEYCRAIAADLKAEDVRTVVLISTQQQLKQGLSVIDGRLYEGGIELADISDLPTLRGQHNWQNAAAAFAAGRALGLMSSEIIAGLATFPGLPHRMEEVGNIGGVAFVNDSKATNADAAAKALACYDHAYWIAGGRPKEGGIAGLSALFPRIRHAFLIGEAADEFAAVLKGKVPVTMSGTLDRAVSDAAAAALGAPEHEAVVLFSPACASFDQFRDYEHRGQTFRRLVEDLTRRNQSQTGGAAA